MLTIQLSPQAAAAELLARRKARSSLMDFTRYTYHRYISEPAHALIAATLNQLVTGEVKRLMIFAPPQHGKSELTSVRLPAFWLGKRPDDPVILTSYGASLAESKSRQVRDIVESGEYSTIFPGVSTRKDSRAVDRWQIAGRRGTLLAVGVGGPITGHGALLGIIDDPFENWEQAQSQTIRDKVWEWYRTTFRTRIWEGGAIVLIMTRWNEDDLAGRLLQEQADRWAVLRLPAIAESQTERDDNNKRLGLPLGQPDPLNRQPGEPLTPQRFSLQSLLELKTDVGSLGWAAEYQGTPRRPDGNRFKRAWFQIVEAAPRQARRVRYWDKAGTEDGGAFTVGVLMALSGDGIFYVEDVVRGQWSVHERERVIKQTAEVDSYRGFVEIWEEQEPGSGGKDSAMLTVQNLAGYAVYRDRVTGSKEVRAEPFAAQAEAGNVRLVRGEWNGGYIERVTAFPNGQYKDEVDSSSGALNKLKLRKTPKKPQSHSMVTM